MQQYTVQPSFYRPDIDAGQIERWLEAQGLDVQEVTIHTDLSTGLLVYVITADADPAPLISGYTPPPDPQKTARLFLRSVFPKLTDGTATTAEMRNAIRALIVLEIGEE